MGIDGKINFSNLVDSIEYYRYLDKYHQLLLKYNNELEEGAMMASRIYVSTTLAPSIATTT